jgi:hypothetical protein
LGAALKLDICGKMRFNIGRRRLNAYSHSRLVAIIIAVSDRHKA